MDPLTLGLISTAGSGIMQGISSLFGNKKKDEVFGTYRRKMLEQMYTPQEIAELENNFQRTANTQLANQANSIALGVGNSLNSTVAKSAMMAPMLGQVASDKSQIKIKALDYNKQIAEKIASAEAEMESSKTSIDPLQMLASGVSGYGLGMQLEQNKTVADFYKSMMPGDTSKAAEALSIKAIMDPKTLGGQNNFTKKLSAFNFKPLTVEPLNLSTKLFGFQNG